LLSLPVLQRSATYSCRLSVKRSNWFAVAQDAYYEIEMGHITKNSIILRFDNQ